MPLYLLAFALTIVSAPFFVLYMLIGRIDIAVAENEVEARLRTASATFFWPSLVLFWLMPKFYRVDIEVPPETTLGVSRTYVLRDLQSGEAVTIELGARRPRRRAWYAPRRWGGREPPNPSLFPWWRGFEMLRWFKKRRPEQKALAELEISVVKTSLLSTEPVNEAWGHLTGEAPMSTKSNFIVRMEMLWFFLHVVNRMAFHIGGPQVRAIIQDAIATKVVAGVIASSFDISQAQEGFDAHQWQQKMISDAIEGLNEAESDYGSCTALFAEPPGPATYLSEQYVVGKLGGRIARAVGQENNPTLWLLVSTTAVEALAKSGFTDQVKNACRALSWSCMAEFSPQ
jgi:hypothetical protein